MLARGCPLVRFGALVALLTSSCGASEAFYRVPITEVPERSFILEIDANGVKAVELVEGEPIRRVAPADEPLFWVSIPRDALDLRLASTPTPTLVLRFVLSPPGCAEDFALPDERRGEPLRLFSPSYARLDPGADAFEPLLPEELPADSLLGRVALVLDEPRSCRPMSEPSFRKLELGLDPSIELGDFSALPDGRIVGADANTGAVYLLREGSPAPLDTARYAPEGSERNLRHATVREHAGRSEVVLITEDKLRRVGAFVRIPINGDRFGPLETTFEEKILSALSIEPDGNMVLIGNEGLLGVYDGTTSSVSYSQPFFPVDLEGLDQMGSPYRYVISDGAGTVYSGDVRTPQTMELRPFSLLGLREIFWFETPFGARIYAKDHSDVLHFGSALEKGASEIWYEGVKLPPELQDICPKEVNACRDARALSAVYRFRKLAGDAEGPPQLLVTFLTCRAAIIFEPGTDCSFGLIPPGGVNDQVVALVRRGAGYLMLTSAGALYEVELPIDSASGN